MSAPLALLLAFQQVITQGLSSPLSGDTTGYWQQHVAYRIVATLDEPAQALHATAELTYVNHSPDTLREMYVHQYLNAFRPGSRWSAADEREGRVRFQVLRDPDYGYERFTAAPTVDGTPVKVEYPGAPDSTVARFTLPRPLAPGDSITVRFAWDARPSTVPRRQGRRGRSWDFAQWYPKVAVYDRGGWEANPLVPAGELYGEYGTYDVTMILPEDQIVGSTGVPVEGDPGWRRVLKWGEVHDASRAYGDVGPGPEAPVPDGFRRVRFVARDVHHFAWSVSPDYRYEGGVYVRATPAPAMRFAVWDSVPVNVLYRPGDEGQWGNGAAVKRTQVALAWLERIYGPYGYPQVTNLHRIEGGGTEFPMMVMNGGASQGLILHEVGHIYSYGMLGNNEWRSGWMDEGLTEYQTMWAEGMAPQDRQTPPSALPAPVPPPPKPRGYRALGVYPSPIDAEEIFLTQLDLAGRDEPIGTRAQDFRDFGTYNTMIYTRAAHMYGALRDVLGDSGFVAFLHDYYSRWAFHHVDERAMRASAERVYGHDLGWFFDQWVHHTGLLDYALDDVRSAPAGGGWVTRARLLRRGDYRHPMPVGVRTASGWTIVRGDPMDDDQQVEVRTADRPLEARIDPLRRTEDWDARNDRAAGIAGTFGVFDPRVTRATFDWPFLDSYSSEKNVVELAPIPWTDWRRRGWQGNWRAALRARFGYERAVDRGEMGLGWAFDDYPGPDVKGLHRLQAWFSVENPRLPGMSRPLMGHRFGAWAVDGIGLLQWSRQWNTSPFTFSRGPVTGWRLSLTGVLPYEELLLPDRWEDRKVAELSLAHDATAPGEGAWSARLHYSVGAGYAGDHRGDVIGHGFYGRIEGSGGLVGTTRGGGQQLLLRGFAGWTSNRTPLERRIGLSAADPLATFANPWARNANFDSYYLPLGGAGLRGYAAPLVTDRLVSANVEVRQRLHTWASPRAVTLWLAAFGDGGFRPTEDAALGSSTVADAGLGLVTTGRLYDRELHLRVDFPLYLRDPYFPVGGRHQRSDEEVHFRVGVSTSDLW